MKRTSFILLILFAFLSFCFQPDYSGATQAPQLVMEKKEFNFGEVEQGEVLSHVFLLKNQGNAALEIKDVRTG